MGPKSRKSALNTHTHLTVITLNTAAQKQPPQTNLKTAVQFQIGSKSSRKGASKTQPTTSLPNLSTDQSTYRPINQPIDRSMNQPNDQPNKQTTNKPTKPECRVSGTSCVRLHLLKMVPWVTSLFFPPFTAIKSRNSPHENQQFRV